MAGSKGTRSARELVAVVVGGGGGSGSSSGGGCSLVVVVVSRAAAQRPEAGVGGWVGQATTNKRWARLVIIIY